MKRLILYNDLDGNELILICDDKDFYKNVFGDGDVKVIDEIIIDEGYDLRGWPVNRSLTADF